jgi:hypothetical protein
MTFLSSMRDCRWPISCGLKVDSGPWTDLPISNQFPFFAVLIQKDRGIGPFDVLASYPRKREGVVLNPITALRGVKR